MTIHSTSTTVADSDISSRIIIALREKAQSQTPGQAERVARVVAKIRDLEARGFLNRQKFSAPTTGDFERKFIYTNDR